ncbi:MAG TPA: hypothetical protein VMR34_02955 [Candidatus Saccharimonadales bacterium]|nr:hypothetical protein [Candidatus Saccharimonadales bacterium]
MRYATYRIPTVERWDSPEVQELVERQGAELLDAEIPTVYLEALGKLAEDQVCRVARDPRLAEGAYVTEAAFKRAASLGHTLVAGGRRWNSRNYGLNGVAEEFVLTQIDTFGQEFYGWNSRVQVGEINNRGKCMSRLLSFTPDHLDLIQRQVAEQVAIGLVIPPINTNY